MQNPDVASKLFKSYFVECNSKMSEWSIKFDGFLLSSVLYLFEKTHENLVIIEAHYQDGTWLIKTEKKGEQNGR